MYLYIFKCSSASHWEDYAIIFSFSLQKKNISETGVSRHLRAQLGAPLEPLNKIEGAAKVLEGFQWGVKTPMIPRDASLSDSCTSDRCFFSVWWLYDAEYKNSLSYL